MATCAHALGKRARHGKEQGVARHARLAETGESNQDRRIAVLDHPRRIFCAPNDYRLLVDPR